MDDDIVVGAACTTLIYANFGAIAATTTKYNMKRGYSISQRL
jgi:hypothetical protein